VAYNNMNRLVKEYKAFFNHARPYQSIEPRVPGRTARWEAPPVTATLSSRPVRNGLSHDYSWLAASSAEENKTQCSTHQ